MQIKNTSFVTLTYCVVNTKNNMKKMRNYIIHRVKEIVKEFRLFYFVAFVCLLCSIYGHVSLPSHYDSKKIATVTDTCVSVEERIEKGLHVTAYYYRTIMELHMSDGNVYYVTEDHQSIFDIDKLKDGLNEKLLTLNYLSSGDKFGHRLLSIKDQFGNVYLSLDDLENANKNIKAKLDIMWGVMIAFCTLTPLSITVPDISRYIRQEKKKKKKKEKRLARQQRFLDDPDSFKNVKNKKKK